MLSRSTLRFVRSLHQKKFREQERSFIAEGPKVLSELLKSDWQIDLLLGLESEEKQYSGHGIPFEVLSPADLERASTLQSPNKVLAIVQMPEMVQERNPEPGFHLLIDQVRDPGNLGTIIRVAHWFGFKSVSLSADSAELFNPKLVQASMGSLFHLPVYQGDLTPLLVANASSGAWPVYSTQLKGENLYETELTAPAWLILGNESRGVQSLYQPFVSKSIRIPLGDTGPNPPDSLNVAIAAAIVSAELRRRFPSV